MDKAALLSKRPLPERDVEIPGVGIVHVRALTRAEAFQLKQFKDISDLEAHMISVAMTDPKLTTDEVKEWAKNSSVDEIDIVTSTISELSGMDSLAAKEAMKTFRD